MKKVKSPKEALHRYPFPCCLRYFCSRPVVEEGGAASEAQSPDGK